MSATGFSLKEWIFTTDHKRVGVLYLIGSLAAFFLAGIMAMLMRAELTTSDQQSQQTRPHTMYGSISMGQL